MPARLSSRLEELTETLGLLNLPFTRGCMELAVEEACSYIELPAAPLLATLDFVRAAEDYF